jgi:mRNA-decapping enzyme subunit 2
VERICFQVEEAQWFYEDFIRPLDPSLPSLSLRAFSLRIFQHCPLFSQWSAQHHTTAFAEFLAYKSRVPVRGAILLSEAMDEVVLVKGWKKSANWSFPRGKINKDENDLDCAVREVYEETGFDAREAGLVKDEKDMKYIEVTMREQHMRLYVFRGVPKDTHFEAKTRKEISKIEWYKLTDLPTLKKSRQHEGSGTDHASLNVNKFYMVAPFLNPLKKWIAQQRKKENRYSSHLAAPPMVLEDVATEEERDTDDIGAQLAEAAPTAISDLPEVTAPSVVDPTSHLKEMLNIGSQPIQHPAALQPSHMPQIDTHKSNALLALLRGKPQDQSGAIPHTPVDQISMPPEVQRSPHRSHVRQPQIDQAQPPPVFSPPHLRQLPPEIQHSFSRPQEAAAYSMTLTYPGHSTPQVAPYQRTGDPLAVPQGASQPHSAAVPPASALPKLTNHTKALLDVFKRTSSTPDLPMIPIGVERSTALPDLDRSRQSEVQSQGLHNQRESDQTPKASSTDFVYPEGNPILRPSAIASLENQVSSLLSLRRPQDAQSTSLLELFNQPSTPKTVPASAQPAAPVELAATAAHTPEKPKANKDDLLLTLLRHGNQEAATKAAEAKRPAPREGETAATVSGPLNQPVFEGVHRSAKRGSNELGRSRLTANRTLYDPNAPTPGKILTRSEEPRPQPPRSPSGTKPASKRAGREKATPKEQAKPFQPQILRRPQTTEGAASGVLPLSSEAATQQPSSTPTAPSSAVPSTAIGEKLIPSRKTSQTDAQKQTLLSLFGGQLDTTPKATTLQPSPGMVSPLTSSQIMSANGEGPVSGIEPISTRTSRVGSMTSIVSGTGTARPVVEKRQTGAENKAFLLGYLGRIATQDQ